MTTVVGIIPARGDSKRLPGKNIKEFCGRPLIAWSIIAARACKAVVEVYVTTDSEEIADISREYGATILMREDPRESLDITGGGIPIYFAALRIEKMRHADAALQLFSTSPLRKLNDLDRFVQAYEETGDNHIFCMRIKDAFFYERIDSRMCRKLIQNKEGDYLYEIGGTSITSWEYFHLPRTGPNTLVNWDEPKTWQELPNPALDPGIWYYLLADEWQMQEIDYQWDFDLCEYFFKKYLLAEWEAIYEKISKRK